ncbi:MAG: MBL fold metallo-hydrolase [Thalassolituus sp.]
MKLTNLTGAAFLSCVLFAASCTALPTNEPVQAHHMSDGTFVNTDGKAINKPFTDLIRWQWTREEPDPVVFEVLQPDLKKIESPEENQITWIGHSTFLLQVSGINVLTDPHFSERASPFSFAGPKRVVESPLSISGLPDIHAVVISHNHYDHLDEESIVALAQRVQDTPVVFYVPLGLKAWFDDLGVSNVRELDWWETESLSQFRVSAVPVRHWSARGMFDRNKTLWAGWMIDIGDFRFFHTGDSGYSKDFKDIAVRFPDIDLATIPIGAYDPRWFMKDAHMDPAEAVQVYQDLQAKKAIGMHWGTFILTDEEMTEPPKLLAQALEAQGLTAEEFAVMQHGELMLLPVSD